jgi:LCP family protein required for cell wall assembly
VAALAADLWLDPASASARAPAGEQVAASTPLVPAQGPEPSATALPTPVPTLTPTLAAESDVTPPACVPPDDWDIYLVQPGNTLYSLSRRFGTDVETLMRVNCLNTTTIFVAQRLYVPGPLPTAGVPTAPPTVPIAPTGVAEVAGTPDDYRGVQPLLETPPPAPKVPGALRIAMPERYLNIVLLGSDKRPQSGAWRTDSMIIVSVDAENNVVRLLSIPRDLWVFIPGQGYERINTADLWGELAKKGGGPERVKQTIYYNLGIPIHYFVRVDFQGFMKIIDTVGGVDIDVDCPLPDIKLTAGIHHMNGQEALRYSRSRYSTNDFDRGRRQRKVLMALWQQALNLDLIPKLPTLWRQMADNYQTDLPLSQVINLAYVGAHLKPQRILNRAITYNQLRSWTTPGGAMVLVPQPDELLEMLEGYYAPANPVSLDTGEKVRVEVLNGGPRKEAEQLAAAALSWGGFKIARSGTAENRDQVTSQILLYTGKRAAGEEVAGLLGLPRETVLDVTGQELPPNSADNLDILVVLGQDYDPCRR